jgi:predicted hotdog family 3-hydroxylacyl-ACP dehydratase
MATITTLDHAGIARLIPHSGSMCLLDRLDAWDLQQIRCSAISHRDSNNPLRTTSGLLAPCAIEYAAQAMALHGALIGHEAGTAASPGFLASARGVQLHRLRIDDLPGSLQVEAVRQAGDTHQILYSFCITHAGEPVADGRATVVLNTPLAQ